MTRCIDRRLFYKAAISTTPPERGCLTIHVKYCKLIVVIRSGLHIYYAVRYKNYRKMSMGCVPLR